MYKTKKDYAQDKLCREIGNGCRILRVDGERCIYRDFGNPSPRKKAVPFPRT